MSTDSTDRTGAEQSEKWGGGRGHPIGGVVESVQQGDHSSGWSSCQGDGGESIEKECNIDGEGNHPGTEDAELGEFLRTKEPSQVFSYKSTDIRGRGMHKFLVKVYGRMTLDQVVHKMRRIISDFNFRSGLPPDPQPIPLIIRRLPRGHPNYDPEMDSEPEYGLDPIQLQRLRESRLSPVPSERNAPTSSNQELAHHKDLPVFTEHENRSECTVVGSMTVPENPTIHSGVPEGPLTGAKRAFEDMQSEQHMEHTRITREEDSVLPNMLVVNPVCTSIATSTEILSPSSTGREILEEAVYTNKRSIPARDIEFVTPPEERGLGIMEESSTAARSRRRYDFRPRDLVQFGWGGGRIGQK